MFSIKRCCLITLVFCLSLLSESAFAQLDTSIYYLDVNSRYVTDKSAASVIRNVIKNKADNAYYTVHDTYLDGKDKLNTHAVNPNGTIFDGICTELYPSGIKKSDMFYEKGKLSGPVKTYFPDGKLYITGRFNYAGELLIDQCRDINDHTLAENGNGDVIDYDDSYSNIIGKGKIERGLKTGEWKYFNKDTLKCTLSYVNGSSIAGIGFDKEGKKYSFKEVSELAQYKNGTNALYGFIKSKIHYNTDAKKAGIRGTVYVAFSLEKDGTLTDIKVTRGLGAGLDEEALRVIKLTASSWLPAKRYGVPIRSLVELPINFGLVTNSPSFKL